MKIIKGKEKEYLDWREKNQDSEYSIACFDRAESWAELMEAEIAKGRSVADCAAETDKLAEPKGITGFMYGMVVSILSQCWEYGEDLRIWHNLDIQIGNEGEKANKKGGVLNPALLNIS